MSGSEGAVARAGRGITGSLGLAGRIFAGTLRLLRRHPMLLLPLMPVFLMSLIISLLIGMGLRDLFMLGAIFVTAYALMFSFAISSRMLKQIHEGKRVSIWDATTAPEMVKMIPRILALSIVWYSLVLVLVLIQMLIQALLERISRGLGRRVVAAIFGVIGDALRISAFMMVAVMVFEDVGLMAAFRRLKEVVREHAVTALGGLALTGIATAAIGFILVAVGRILGDTSLGAWALVVLLPLMAIGWLLAIYLEQMFITGLYLYSREPDSPVVAIMLEEFVGMELPRPALLDQPVV